MAHAFLETGYLGTPVVFEDLYATYEAWTLDALPEVFATLEQRQREGFFLVGFVGYEVGAFFEPSLRLPPPALDGPTPLLCIGAFYPPREGRLPAQPRSISPVLRPTSPFEEYKARFAQIKEWIAAGDVYQVNVTFPMEGHYDGDPVGLYETLCAHQNPAYGAVLNFGTHPLVSFSPELFFQVTKNTIRVRPMKGTSPRGKNPQEDEALRHTLANDPKQCSENLMIVDLMRHDLSKICEVGSVKVQELFHVETYPTLHQMVSSVEGTLRAPHSLAQILKALFPCGSVTGAPKMKAMERIWQLEQRPRGPYCGAIGVVAPNGDMCWNVAIRTAVFEGDGRFSFSVGSGVVWDSQDAEEYEECLLKARFLTRQTGTMGER